MPSDILTARLVRVTPLCLNSITYISLCWATGGSAVQGQLVGKRFVVREFLGAGAEAQVYRAIERETDHEVALKFQFARGHETVRTYRGDGENLAHAAHLGMLLADVRGVPEVFWHGRHGERHCLATEFVDGISVEEAICKARPVRCVATLAATLGQICETLSAMHDSGLVHCDLKPENLLIGARNDLLHILDLGSAEFIGRPFRGGTSGYAAPENLDQLGPVSARADVFSLGCVLIEMTTMKLPYGGQEGRPEAGLAPLPAADAALIPTRLRDLALRMVAYDPDHRPRDARAVLAELAPLLPRLGDPRPVKAWDPDPTARYRCCVSAEPPRAVRRARRITSCPACAARIPRSRRPRA
ncbi:serine/threonine-protein kinase [Streptomyces katrae]|uniref:non-specific serine/threonine protein kinase n=1 Tax=Streptomyces katrae TaxID=68223 RepID=A0ABT7H5J4_9ACTN|nr:serine/threonine-protein kinase [Streptomyces katrae]MDK9500340.1 serine/threonine-protein kinase [Streptomyces katrae]